MTTTQTQYDAKQTVELEVPDPRRRRRFQRSVAGFAAAGAALVLATTLNSNAEYSDKYVTDQLVRQRITFKAADALTDEERKHECVVANAGRPLTTGKQAECYANDFIGTHAIAIGKGRTYAELGDDRSGVTAKIVAAQAAGETEQVAQLQKELAELTGQRETLFKAETLRGILLTSFGFSTLGEKAAEGASVAYGAAGVLALLSLGGIIQAGRTPRTTSE